MPIPDPLYLPYDQQVRYVVEKVHVEGSCDKCLTAVLAHPELHAWFEDDGEDGPIFSGETHARSYTEMFAKYNDASAAWLHILGSLYGVLGPSLPVGPDIDAQPVSDTGITEIINIIRLDHPKLDFVAGLTHLSIGTAEILAPILKLLEGIGPKQALPISADKQVPARNRRQGHLGRPALQIRRTRTDASKPVARLESGEALLQSLNLHHVIEVGRTRAIQSSDLEDPKRLEYWLSRFRWSVLQEFLPTFRKQSDEMIGPLADAITNALLNYRDVADALAGHDDPELTPWNYQRRVPAALASELAPYLSELLSRLDRRTKDDELLWMCWRYAIWIFGEKPDELDPTVRKRLKQMAVDELGRMRTLTRQADRTEAKEKFTQRLGGFYDDLLTYVCTFGTIWDALKPLVLALRAFNTPCVAADLRYWGEGEHGFEPVPVWSWVPNVAAGIVHRYAAKEEKQDLRLEKLRRDLATFCLERLRAPDGGERIEPSAVWREGYVRAARDLRVNPHGRGHRVLDFARKKDPNPAVRHAADEAYTEIRHGEDLPEKRSPRRAILAALWWLRRAHFIELRGEAALDVRGALRTRNREGRRTQEPEEPMNEP